MQKIKRESSVEKALTKKLIALGCLSMKAGQNGWPDRLYIAPNGQHFWVEFKAPGKKVRALQGKVITAMSLLGALVVVIDDADSELAKILLEQVQKVRKPADVRKVLDKVKKR